MVAPHPVLGKDSGMRPRILALLLLVLILSPAAGSAAGLSAAPPGTTAPSVSWWQGLLDKIEVFLAAWSAADTPPENGTAATGTTHPIGDYGDDGCHIDPLGCPK